MSLINDALKRAKQAQHKHTPPAMPGAPMRPVESLQRTPPSSGALWLVLVALVLGLAAAVLIFVAVRGGKTRKIETASAPAKPSPGQNSAPNAKTAAPTPPAKIPVKPAATQPAAPAESTPAQPVEMVKTASTPAVARATETPIVKAPESTEPVPTNFLPAMSAPSPRLRLQAPVEPPVMPKLQGILYRPDAPSALLNGRAVYVGEHSGEFLVAHITQQTVTLVREGVTNVLRLGQ